MKNKKAVITVELVDESTGESNNKIVRELLEWFEESEVSMPWVKGVKDVAIRDC